MRIKDQRRHRRPSSGIRGPRRPRAHGLALLASLIIGLFVASPIDADWVGSLVNRVFIDPASIAVVADGFDNGDVVSFILETTPADTGSDIGHAAWMSVYIPPGAEVVSAEFVLPAANGGYDMIPAEDTDRTYDGWGSRGNPGYGPTTGAIQLAPGYVNEVQQDTGIFYSTDIRAKLVVDGVDNDCDGTADLLDPTGGPPAQIIYNRYDWDHVRGFGIDAATSGNGGKGNTPIRGTSCTGANGVGCTWTGTGSIVAGPETYYRNDYNPGHDDCSDGPGGAFAPGCDGDGLPTLFVDEVACQGPWRRIVYANSKIGGSDSPEKCRPGNTCPPDPFEADPTILFPAYEQGEIRFTGLPTGAGWDFGISGALPSGNLPLSSNPSPETTYMVRYVHGKRRLGELENARITLRIVDLSLFSTSVFIDDGAAEATDDETFCLDSTGGDTSDTAAKDNPFRYYEPRHECAFLAGKGNLLKQVKFVNNQPSSGASLSVGDVISYRISFTNISGSALTLVDLYDRAEDFFGSPVANLDLLEPGDPLCAWPSYDGDLPGPAYQAGSAAAGEARWNQIATLAAGSQVNVFLCAEVTGGGVNDRIDNSALVDYNFSSTDRVLELRSTAGGTITTSISGTVYSDPDASGDLTVGDGPAVGVTVSLYLDDGDGMLGAGDLFVDSRITLTDGSYSFAGIVAGDYIVVETDPVGWTSSGDKDNLGGPCGVGNGCNTIGTVTLTAGGASTLNDFYDQAPAGATNIINGTTYVDRDLDALFEPGDGEVGRGGILVRLYRDENGDGMVDIGDTLLQTLISSVLGQYQFTLTEDPQAKCGVAGCDYVLEIDETTLPPGASLTTDNVEVAHFDNLGDPIDTGNDFGFFGGAGTTGGVCFAVADSVDELVAYEPVTMTFTDIGPTGTFNIEAIAFEPGTATLCAANADRMGTLDLGTGLFTQLPSAFGSCTLPGGGSVGVNDVDGLTFDPFTRLLWGSVRRGEGASVNDALVVIDPLTGLVAPDEVDPFGPGVTCVEIDTIGAGLGVTDIDDLAIDPTTRAPGGGPLMFATANQDSGGAGINDRLIVIDTNDGSVTDIARIMLGASGLDDVEGLGFDNAGVLYSTTGNEVALNNDKLYTLDEATAAATLIVDLFRAGPPALEDYESVDCLTAGANVITGTVFADGNGTGVLDPGDVGQAGVTVSLYRDVNSDNMVDAGDELLQTVLTDADGEYSFFLGVEGDFVLETNFPTGYTVGSVLTTDNIEEADFVGFNQTEAGNDFGFALPNVPEITKTSSAEGGVVAQGETITYTLIPRIPGPQLLTNVEVDDFIPAGTTFVVGSATPTQSEGPDPLEWELGDHAPGVVGTIETALCPALYSQVPEADTFIRQDQANNNFGGNNDVKTRPEAGNQKHALLRWDLSSIPAGAVPDEARLTVISRNARNNHVAEVREVTTNWVEAGGNGATWNDAAGTVNDWATPDSTPENPAETDGFVFGVNDYDTTVPTPPTLVPVGGNLPVTAWVTDIVTSWLGGTNNGLVMLATGTDNGDGNWDSKEEGDPARRPLLEIFYRVPTGDGCAGVETLVASGDTFVQEDTADTNRGADADLKTRPEATKQKQVLIDFDIVGVPPGATINSATFTVEVTGGRGSNHTVNLHRMLTSWTESGATWNDSIPGTSDWLSVATGTENPAETDGFTFGMSDYAESYGTIDVASTGSRSLDVTALVDAWVNNPAVPQNGVVLLATGIDNGDAKYDSRDKAKPPTLVVDWTLDPDQTTNEMTAVGTLVSHNDTVTVTMTLTSAQDDTGVVPGTLTVNGVNGASAVCGGPSPASQDVTAGSPITFDWTCTASATAGQLLGRLTLEASAAGATVAFANAVSHTVMVAPPLVFSVLVDNPIDANQTIIINTGIADSDQTFPDAFDTTVDAVVKGVIGDRVWLDTDGDGVQDIGEEGIANVEVALFDAGADMMVGGGDDVLVATMITDADGKYLFTDLPPGTYFVDVTDATIPAGLTVAPGTADPSASRTVTTNEVHLDLDFGYVPDAGTAVIGDYIWSDADDDGVQDPGEPGIGGVTVELISAGPDGIFATADDVVEATTITTPDGKYFLTGVAAGDYVVEVATSNFAPGGALEGYAVTSGPQSQGDETSEPITVLADDVFVDADFGFFQAGLGTIGSQVWLDEDGDGVFDGGSENGITGVSVDLVVDTNGDGVWDPDGPDDMPGNGDDEPVIATALTGADGSYSFTGLVLDDGGGDGDADYLVVVSDDAGRVAAMSQTFGAVGVDANGQTDPYAVALSAGSPSDNTADFAFEPPNAIGDKIWSDADGDGLQDPEEIGLGGVLVNLLDDMGSPVPDALGNPITATTAPDGSYLFAGVDPGDYTVEVDSSNFAPAGALEGYIQTGDPDGTCPGVDCDNESDSTITVGSSDLTRDFGYQADTAAVYPVNGTVFEDPDSDGVQETGEPGIPGVTVALLDSSGNVLATTTTDANGDYVFPDLPDGDYTVTVTDTAGVLEGYTLTSGLDERDVEVMGAPVTDVDFGYVRDAGTAAIGDRVWFDANRNGIQEANESGISGVTLDLYDVGSDGIAGTGDDILVGPTATDANGDYLFPGLEAGSYYVDVTDTGGVLAGLAPTPGTTDPSAAIDLSEGEQYRDADFGYATATDSALGDTIWYDANGNGFEDPGEVGIAGVTVNLIDPGMDLQLGGGDDVPVGSVMTDARGNYLFLGLGPGSANCTQPPSPECRYFVDVDTTTLPAGYNPTPTNGPALRPFAVFVGADTLSADFGFDGGTTGSIGDTVYLDVDGDGIQDAGEPGIAGVTIDLVDDGTGEVLASMTTDSDGGYDFVGLPARNYNVVVTDLGNVLPLLNPSQSPALPITITAAGDDVDTADFGYVPSGGVGSIGNQIWRDKDADGLFEPLGDDGVVGTADDETGFEGVTVQLWLDDGDGVYEPFSGDDNLVRTAVTEADGKYEFLDLPPGTYFVTLTDKAGVLAGFIKTLGPMPGMDNNSQAQPGYRVDVTAADPRDQTADFGYESPVDLKLSGTVFFDVNGDGIFDDPSEKGVESVELFLFRDLSGNGELDPGEPLIDRVTVSDGTIDVDDDGIVDPVGFYVFIDLPSGSYIVTADPSSSFVDGLPQTTQVEPAVPQGGVQPVALVAADSTDNDFGFTIGPTAVLLSGFEARTDGKDLVVRWETLSQAGTVGFYLYRLDSETGRWEQVNDRMLPALLDAPQGAVYELREPVRSRGTKLVYSLVEVEAAGAEKVYGPFEPRLDAPSVIGIPWVKSGAALARRPSERMARRLAEMKASREVAATAAASSRRSRPPSVRPEQRVKIEIAANGLYRLTVDEMATGLEISQGAVQAALRAGNLELSSAGEPVSWTTTQDGILFYGEGIDHPYAKSNVYWLRLQAGQRMKTTESNGAEGGSESFAERKHFESDVFAVTIVPNSSVEDFYYWAFVMAGHPTSGTATVDLDVADPTRLGSARLALELQGITSTVASIDHQLVARLNGTQVGSTSWNGAVSHRVELDIPAGLLQAGANSLELEGLLDGGLPYSSFLLDSVDLTYHRRLRAKNDQLMFTPGVAGAVTVSGFSSPGVRVFDITSARRPVRPANVIESLGDGWTVTFSAATPESRYMVVGPEAIGPPAVIRTRPAPGLLEQHIGVDYVVIAPAELATAAQALVDYRSAFGLSARLVELEEIQDVFAHGLATPVAIRDFFRFAYSNWNSAPRYGVLAGAGNFDYKDAQGLDSNLVPPLVTATPYGLFASDALFGDVVGEDGIPEVAIGRIPALTDAELSAYVDKLARYETAGPATTSMLFLADDGDDAGNFPLASDALVDRLPAGTVTKRAYLSQHSVADARQLIFDTVASGVLAVNYLGHGGLNRLAHEGLLMAADAENLVGPRMPVFATLTCSVGRFEVPGFESLAEALVMAPASGAAAVFAPTGQALHFEATEMNKVWVDALFSHGNQTVGEAVLETLAYNQVGDFGFMRRIFNLLGDPAFGIE